MRKISIGAILFLLSFRVVCCMLLHLAQDENFVYAAYKNGCVRVFDKDFSKPIEHGEYVDIKAHDRFARVVATGFKGNCFVSSGGGYSCKDNKKFYTIKVYRNDDWEGFVCNLNISEFNEVRHIVVSPCGGYFVYAVGKELVLFDGIYRFSRVVDANITSLAFHPSGKYLLVGLANGLIQVYCFPGLEVLEKGVTTYIRAKSSIFRGFIRNIIFSEDGKTFAYICRNSYILVGSFDETKNQGKNHSMLKRERRIDVTGASCMKLSPDGKDVIVAQRNKVQVIRWRRKKRKRLLYTFPGDSSEHSESISALLVHQSKEYVHILSGDPTGHLIMSWYPINF